MTDCSQIHLLLGAYADGEIDAGESAAVEAHLKSCPDCPAALTDFHALGAALRDLPQIALPPNFDRVVTRRIARLHGGWRARLAQFRESMGTLGAALEVASVAAVAAVLTLFVAGSYMSNFNLHRALQLAANPAPPPRALTPSTAQPRPNPAPDPNQLAAAAAGQLADADAAAALDSQEVLSALGGGSGPSVAVWNEPRTDTTVVWVPDQR